MSDTVEQTFYILFIIPGIEVFIIHQAVDRVPIWSIKCFGLTLRLNMRISRRLAVQTHGCHAW